MKKLLLHCTLTLLFGVALATAAETNTPAAPKAEPKKEAAKPAATGEVAVVKTSEGEMVLEFWPDVAPGHVENFKKLAKQGFYDGTCFHRVIKGFMIQGGDPNTKDESKKDSWGMGGPGYTIKAEFNDKPHVRGVLSMARSSDPNSAGSQFFVCHGDPRFLDRQYTAFGKLIKGDEVLEKIATTPTERPDRPLKRVNIESIKIVAADSIK
jgi:peptidyl-prolyl cis-trans isomerase B (cyclophilin B)